MTSGSTTRALVLGLILGAVTLGCNEPTKVAPPPVGDGYLPQSSAANVLANLKKAYEERKIDKYTRLVSHDFVFIFNPLDARYPADPTPMQWFRDEEVASATHMFAASQVDSIQLDLTPGPVEAVDSLLYGAGTSKVRVTARLRVDVHAEDGEQLIFFVPAASEVFYLRADPSRLAADGKPSLYILRWEDLGNHAAKSETMTWGRVKNTFQ